MNETTSQKRGWAKGLTRDTDDRILRSGIARRGRKTWAAGLTKETDSRLKEKAEKFKCKLDNGEILHNWVGKKHSAETRAKMSASRKLLYQNGFQTRCGRTSKITYNSPIAGSITLDGTWELKVAEYFDSISLNWKRNTQRFPYIHLNGKQSTYCPDFFVEDWQCYIEVKGYETDLDRCKWSQFPFKLEVWKKQKLKELKLI